MCVEIMKTDRSPRLILASSSPRRRSLLARAGVKFDVVDPPLDEPTEIPQESSPAGQAEALAYFKARAVADQYPRAVVLAADTLVATSEGVLGKPSDQAQARSMLHRLSGTRHQVITGVAMVGPGTRREITSATTYVTMREMTEEQIEAYIASGEWVGKAGAYAIQETADRYIETLEGSFTNVVGLPMELVLEMLQRSVENISANKGLT